MSDEEEYEYEYDSNEDYQMSDAEGDQDEVAIEIENSYYEADDCRQDDPRKALGMYEKVVELEKGRGDEVKWRFKALEQIVCLQFRLNDFDTMVERYKELLSHMDTVTRNECTDAINCVLDSVSSSTDLRILEQMYDQTLTALRDASNERLWFNTNVKFAKLCLDSSSNVAGVGEEGSSGEAGGEGRNAKLSKVASLVAQLHASCQTPDGEDDLSKGTSLLEVYALDIQLCAASGNVARLRSIYPNTLKLDAAIADPRILGVIREEGGKMYMREHRWELAYNEFYEGFRNYQEAGNSRAKDCLKLVVLANMLALSDINPFDSREAKVYKDDKEILAMMQLRSAYEMNDISAFERLLRDKRNHIIDDPFIMKFVDPLLRNIRSQVLLKLVKPYQHIRIDFVSKELNVSAAQVEELCVSLILDKQMQGRIDQRSGFLHLGGAKTSLESKKFEAIGKWSDTLRSLTANLDARLT